MNNINKPIYNIKEFNILQVINNRLKHNITNIQRECDLLVKNKKEISIKRKEGEWSNDGAKKLVNILNENNDWMYGWTQKENWKNFLILYDSNIMYNIPDKLPTLYNIINDYKNNFNVVGLSLLEPFSDIPYHNDVDTHIENDRLVYHFNIYIPNDYNNLGKSIISLWDKNNKVNIIEQKTGNHLIFDNSYNHSVKHNNPFYRLILFCDIKVSKMK